MTVGNIAALTQSNIKRMLAYSSIAHAGYLLIGVVGRARRRGITATLIYLFIYAFMQLGAFAVVDAAAAAGRDRRRAEGPERPVRRAARSPALAMLLFMLSLGGIPPTAGFMGKFWLFSAAIDGGLRLAGRDRRAQQRRVALLLPARRRLHVDQGRGGRARAGHLAGAWRWLLAVAIVGDASLIGVYPRPLFDFADASARALGAFAGVATAALH